MKKILHIFIILSIFTSCWSWKTQVTGEEVQQDVIITSEEGVAESDSSESVTDNPSQGVIIQ